MERDQQVDQQQAQARAQFLGGLQMLGELLDKHMQNFSWCAAILAGSPDAPEQLLAMLEYGRMYREYGMQEAEEAIDDGSGITFPISVRGSDKTRQLPGIVTALIDAKGEGKRKRFIAVAIVPNQIGQETIVEVEIEQNGQASLKPEGLERGLAENDPHVKRLQRDLGW